MVETLEEETRPEEIQKPGCVLKKGLQPDGPVIRQMFADCAPKYDFLNHTLSGGVDRLWRRHTGGNGRRTCRHCCREGSGF